MGKIVAIANQKGGVGKTTTNINLSSCVALNDKKVLTIDLDPQSNTTSGLGIREKQEKTIYDVLINEEPIENVIMKTCVEGLDICPGTIDLAGAEIEMVAMMSREHRLKSALETVKDKYDFIFIDCPPSLGLLTLNSLTACNSVLVPIQCEYYALEGLSQLMNTIKMVKKHLNKNIDVEGVVMTMFDARTNLAVSVVEEVKKHFNNKVYKTIIPRNVKLGEAPSFGVPIKMYDPKSKGTEMYEMLALEFLEYAN